MFFKKKTTKVPVIEEGVIRKESITDGESLMLASKLLMQWATESKKKGWTNQEGWPVAIFIVNLDPSDYAQMRLNPKGQKQVKMSMLGFVNALTPGELKDIMSDTVRAYIRTGLKQMQANK